MFLKMITWEGNRKEEREDGCGPGLGPSELVAEHELAPELALALEPAPELEPGRFVAVAEQVDGK